LFVVRKKFVVVIIVDLIFPRSPFVSFPVIISFFPATFYSSSAADDARLLSSESRLASPGLHVISNSISCFGDADPRRPSDSDSRGLACDCGSVGTESSSIGIDSGYRVWGYLSADDFLDEEVFDSETRPHVDFQTAAILGLG